MVFGFNNLKNVINSCDSKAEFSSAIALLNLLLVFRKYYLLLLVSRSLQFCGNSELFSLDSLLNRKFKRTAFEI